MQRFVIIVNMSITFGEICEVVMKIFRKYMHSKSVTVGRIATEIVGLKCQLHCNIANWYITVCEMSVVSGIIYFGTFSLRLQLMESLKLLHTECFLGNLSYVSMEAYNFLCWRIAGDLYEISINHGKSFNRWMWCANLSTTVEFSLETNYQVWSLKKLHHF
jgi:hypothetical protein